MSLLVGFIDQEVSPSDQLSWSDNKIGGQPIWMTSNSGCAATSKCRGCGVEMTLVVQLYCPLANSCYHRCLYIFVCTTTGCSQHHSWKVFRSMLIDESYNSTKQKESETTKDFNDDMWADDQDDWGDDDDDNGDDDGWGKIESDDDDDGAVDDLRKRSTSSSSQSSFNFNISNAAHCESSDKSLAGETNPSYTSVAMNESKELPGGATSSHNAMDSDLSASLSSMVVEDSQACSPPMEGDSVMEDLHVPDVHSRLDQLASVLNTKCNQEASPSPTTSSKRSVQLKPYYLSVEEDTTSKRSHNALAGVDDRHIASLVRDYEKVEGKRLQDLMRDREDNKGGKGGSEVYEKADIKHGDRVFHKFLKELQKFPGQCIRYERCSQPLLVQCLNPVQSIIPPCGKCGASRVFELQLVPALIPWLSTQVEGSPSNIEYGTILVYTCSKSCPPSSSSMEGLDLFEEHIIVQYDPDHHLYR